MKPRNEYPFIICKFCKTEAELCYVPEVNGAMFSKSLCFYCNFWDEKLTIKDNPNVARILEESGEIHHYQYLPDQESGMRGFGGAGFTIQFNDGRIVKTKNLWHQGQILKHFQDQLPINAKFINTYQENIK